MTNSAWIFARGRDARRTSLSRFCLGACAAVALVVSACSEPTLEEKLEEARGTWAAAKGGCGRYSYVREVSVVGFETWTAVEITDDVPTRRRLTDETQGERFDEHGAEVGTHPAAGANVTPASTIEQLFSECATLLRQNPDLYRPELTIGDRGIPLECFSWAKGAANDGTPGIQLNSFACAPLTANGGVPSE